MDRTNYQAAHAFIARHNLNHLDTLKYPNVRDPNPGASNFAIFKSESFKPSANVDAEDLILIPRIDETIEVQRTQSETETVQPMMR